MNDGLNIKEPYEESDNKMSQTYVSLFCNLEFARTSGNFPSLALEFEALLSQCTYSDRNYRLNITISILQICYP